MARFIFPEWTSKFRRALAVGLTAAPVVLVALVAYGVTPEAIRIGYQPEQPVPYSHALHVGELGIECRYCHNTVERSSHAAIPPAATCMNCHTGIHPESEKLLPVREAYSKDEPLRWIRVHDLPDYVFFNHAAHVTRGVGCESCHGRVDQMEKVYQAKALTMKWCLDCHRDPDDALRPYDKVFEMGWTPDGQGSKRRSDRNINPPTNCSTCHR